MLRKRRDLSVTIYRILLFLSRMRERESSTRRLMRIERATGIERKELKEHLLILVESGHIELLSSDKKGRGGHKVSSYSITQAGRSLRSDLGRLIDLSIRL